MSKVQFLDQLMKDFKSVAEQDTKTSQILTNNKNRLKLKEFSKKLLHFKSELANKLQQLDLQFANFKEHKLSIAAVLNREISRMQKTDEDLLKDTQAQIKKLIDFDQRLILEFETVFENQQTISNEELQAAAQAFEEFEQQTLALKAKTLELKSVDFKLLSLSEYQSLIHRAQEKAIDPQGHEFFKNEQKINLLLSQQLEEKNSIIHGLQTNQHKLTEYEQLIEQQAQLFNLPPPTTFNFKDLSHSLFDHIHALVQGYTLDLKQARQASDLLLAENDALHKECVQLQDYIYELKHVNQRVLSDSKHRENQFKQKIDDSKQILEEKIKLQNEVTNLLNTSIEIEKENSAYTAALQQHTHQLKQLQKANANLYKENSKLKSDLDGLFDVKQNLSHEVQRLEQQNLQQQDAIEQLRKQVGQLEALVAQYQQTIQSIQQQQLEESMQLDQSYNDQLYKLKQQYNLKLQQLDYDNQQKVNIQIKAYEAELEKASKQLVEEQSKFANLKIEFDSYKAKSEILIQQARAQAEKTASPQELEQQLKIIEKQREQIQQNQNTIDQQKFQMLDLQKTVNNQKEQILEQRQQLYQCQQENEQELKKVKKDLQDIQTKYEKEKYDMEQEHEEAVNQLQQEYVGMMEEQQKELQAYEQTTKDQKLQLMMLQRQVESLEFQKQQEMLQYKIEFDKKTFKFSKELDQVKDILSQSVNYQQVKDTENFLQKQLQQTQEQSSETLRLTQQKYEQMIQEMAQQYEKQISYLQDQVSFQKNLDTSKRNSSKPPKIQQKSPACNTNSPVSSIQQSFYREVARFSKELDESNEEQRNKRSVGIVKQNRHIFIEDDHNSTIRSDQTPSQHYCSTRQEQAIQTEEINEDIFPPFDHRVCLRCKKNDMVAPNFCKFREVNQITELANSQGSGKLKSSRVLKEHIYGANMSWRQKDPFSAQKSNYFSTFERTTEGMNTILSLVNDPPYLRKHSRSSQKQKRNSESLSISFTSKNDSNRSGQQH